MTTAQDRLIEKHRDINIGPWAWWNCIEDDLKSEMLDRGFTVNSMYFSGFWSQGDGACFEGHMSDWEKFCATTPEFVTAFPYLSEYLKDVGANYTVVHSGHYSHENCTNHTYESELEYVLDTCDFEPDDPKEMMLLALYQKARGEEGGVYDWLKEHFKSQMRQLYRDLEKEYDYLTSDEAVWESIVANELDKELEDEDVEEVVCAGA